ncbi:MAG: hypothetical protein VCD66_10590 [Alphaproteobacteria bacterium]
MEWQMAPGPDNAQAGADGIDLAVSEQPMFSPKVMRKVMRQVAVSSSILIVLVPVLLFIVEFGINPIWGLILTIAIIGIYIVRVMHEGQYRLAQRLESLAVLVRKTNEQRRRRREGP